MAQAGGRVPARGLAEGATPLASFVRAHRVCWEIAPHVEASRGQLRHTGLELTLHAQTPAGIDPGAPEARTLHERLREIAQLALPNGARLQAFPFAAQLHMRRDTAWRAEVDLVLELDGAAAHALAGALLRLGVPEGVYAEAA